MSATFDATTTSEYATATTAAARSALIVAALTGTISVKVFDGSDVEKGSGTMASPWATSSGDTVTVGEVSSFTVGATGTPDSNWYIRFQNAGVTRWVRGSFGLDGSGQDFTWSLATWASGQTGTIGAATIITTGATAPVFTVAPLSQTVPATGGTIQFTATDANGLPILYTLSARSGFTINSSTGLVTVNASAAGSTGNITVTASNGVLTTSTVCAVTVSASSARVVYYNGDFAGGSVPNRTSLQGGGYFACKYEPEGADASYYTNPSNASGATASNLDGRVLQSETWNGDLITPRNGTYFMRQAIYYTKDYKTINDSSAPAADDDKPRVKFDQSNAVYSFPWDTEMWFGFSIRLSDSYVPEVGSTNNASTTMVWVINTGSASGTQLTLTRQRRQGTSTERWWAVYQINATSVADMDGDGASPGTTYADLGETSDDIGLWTDFVIRVRFNPFTTATNPASAGIANGANQLYQGNRGILQIWKGTGAYTTGKNRQMTRLYSRVNLPVGGVPGAGMTLVPSHRMYKFGWKFNPTSSTAPVYQGFDEIRYGFGDATLAATKGQSRATVSSDVAPSNEVLT
jgi:hypothetical protein